MVQWGSNDGGCHLDDAGIRVHTVCVCATRGTSDTLWTRTHTGTSAYSTCTTSVQLKASGVGRTDVLDVVHVWYVYFTECRILKSGSMMLHHAKLKKEILQCNNYQHMVQLLLNAYF